MEQNGVSKLITSALVDEFMKEEKEGNALDKTQTRRVMQEYANSPIWIEFLNMSAGLALDPLTAEAHTMACFNMGTRFGYWLAQKENQAKCAPLQ